MTNKQPKIEIAHLAKSFGNKTVLRDVSLSIPAGQSLCIIGTSGCGKSVTLKCLLGLITPDEGSIKIDGVERNKRLLKYLIQVFLKRLLLCWYLVESLE